MHADNDRHREILLEENNVQRVKSPVTVGWCVIVNSLPVETDFAIISFRSLYL